ncbi:MAG: class I SAM-dependent methyltransferase [Desulfovermiculus sp.]|nr:class I SAM-dependent methyltransferase [Desulfovermiculus sp.]
MTPVSTVPICPLCFRGHTLLFHRDRQRRYYHCTHCHVVFVPQEEHITLQEEKARYDRHNNDEQDPGYRKFVSRVLVPLKQYVPPPAEGLDFGCGPGPALAALCREAGYTMDIFDPFYAPNHKVWDTTYDFLTCTEVVEHLRHPGITLPQVWSLLRPGGCMGIMTKLVNSHSAFINWHYIRDETHIAFYSPATFRWLADKFKAQLSIHGQDVILLHKQV